MPYNYGKGGLRNGRGASFFPYKKGGGRKKFSHAEVGGTKSFKVVLTQELEVFTIGDGGGGGKFPPFKRGGRKSFTLSVSNLRFSRFLAPPPSL